MPVYMLFRMYVQMQSYEHMYSFVPINNQQNAWNDIGNNQPTPDPTISDSYIPLFLWV